jgi:hypothetical protein
MTAFRKIIIAATFAAAAAVIATPADATGYSNGWRTNGVSENGLSRNGLSRNGLSRNGLSRNGLSRNGWRATGGASETVVGPDDGNSGPLRVIAIELPR